MNSNSIKLIFIWQTYRNTSSNNNRGVVYFGIKDDLMFCMVALGEMYMDNAS